MSCLPTALPEHVDAAIRILLVDDDEDDFVVTRDLLADSRTPFELDWISTFDEAIDALIRDEHDLYLIDYRLGEHNGLELLSHAVAPTDTDVVLEETR